MRNGRSAAAYGLPARAIRAGDDDRARVRLLDVDRELARAVRTDALPLAREVAVATAFDLPAGGWDPPTTEPVGPTIGLLVLEGLLMRRIALMAGGSSVELVGEEDLVRPWQQTGSWDLLEYTAEWTVTQPARLAVLDARFLARVAPFPEIAAELTARALRRSRHAAVLCALGHLLRVEDRLMALFFHLADRWGRVLPEGIVVPYALKHADIAELVGARRPSVTTALRRLSDEGALVRCRDRTWLLRHTEWGRRALSEVAARAA